jgi:mannosyl-3-phosphoglycerate phosphatase
MLISKRKTAAPMVAVINDAMRPCAERPNRLKTVVFTDLDATLLDPRTYSWASANKALEALKERGASIVLVSSKTVAEIELIHSELALDDPFIVENGGGIIFHSRTHLAYEFLSFKAPAKVSRQEELYKISLGVCRT